MNYKTTSLLLFLWGIAIGSSAENAPKDWLINGDPFKATVDVREDTLRLSNGLMSRTFVLSPNVATIGLDNLMTGNSELRAVRPEAIVTLDGKDYPVGGLNGQPVQNYFTTGFLHEMKVCDTAFIYTGYEIGETIERFPYRPHEEWTANKYPWPAPGKRIVFTYQPAPKIAEKLKGITVKVIYELYDKAPILSKQIEVENRGTQTVVLNAFKSEILTLTETAPKVHYGEPHEVRMMAQEAGTYTKDYRKKAAQTDAPRDYIDRFTQLFVVTDYAMGGDMEAMKDNPAVRWVFDHPEYEATGIRYYGQYKPARLEVTPLIGPNYEIAPGETFQSCTAFEMLRDATDTERRGLADTIGIFWNNPPKSICPYVNFSNSQATHKAIPHKKGSEQRKWNVRNIRAEGF